MPFLYAETIDKTRAHTDKNQCAEKRAHSLQIGDIVLPYRARAHRSDNPNHKTTYTQKEQNESHNCLLKQSYNIAICDYQH